jgi:VIT1/CCC1 family predicted Fe2+/Mn2+ transporter
LRNICIGLVDGLTIPLAVAAGLSGVLNSGSVILTACLAVSLAGALTMSVGGYHQSKRYAAGEDAVSTAFIIGSAYFIGGLITTLPYFFVPLPIAAFKYAAIIALVILFVAGYWESKLNGGDGWMNAIRVCITAAVAATAAYLVARLFT